MMDNRFTLVGLAALDPIRTKLRILIFQ
jgi:hypothetical protein